MPGPDFILAQARHAAARRLARTLCVMSTVSLSLRLRGEELPPVEASGVFPPEAHDRLREFVRLVGRVRVSALLLRGMPGLSRVRFDTTSGLTLTSEDYTDAELFELLHVLRPVILEEEPFSFHRTSSMLGRYIDSQDVRDYLKLQTRVFRHGEMNLYMRLSVNNQPLFDESLLRLWLNGTQYHSDAEKAAAWGQLEASLSESGSRALVISQLRGKVLALFNVDYVARQVVEATTNDA